MKRLLSTTVAVLVLTTSALAGGPPYSRFGIGDLTLFGSNRSYAMNVMGVALTQEGYINIYNPAALSRLSFTRFAGGFEFFSSTLKDAADTQSFATGGFQSLAIAVPVSTSNGVALFAGTSPTSAVNYDVTIPGSIAGNAVTQNTVGTGGLSALFLGTSYRPSTDLSLGLTYTYHYGTIRQRLVVDFADGSFADNELRKSFFHSGSSFTLGLTYDGISDLFGSPSLKPVTIGLVLTTPASLSVKEERLLFTENSADTSLIRRGSTTLPLSWTAGMAYAAERIVVAADVAVQQWNSANFFEPSPVGIRNSLRAAVGIEIPGRTDPVTYWDRVAYRAGFAYTSSYIVVNGQPVNGWSISGGLGLPIGPDARMNLGLQYGSRGSTANGLTQDTFIRFSVSVDAGEAWFITVEDD
jgi:hypothetical protein